MVAGGEIWWSSGEEKVVYKLRQAFTSGHVDASVNTVVQDMKSPSLSLCD